MGKSETIDRETVSETIDRETVLETMKSFFPKTHPNSLRNSVKWIFALFIFNKVFNIVSCDINIIIGSSRLRVGI